MEYANHGTYLLLFKLRQSVRPTVKGKPQELSAGYYVYTGRAKKHLAQRLRRHMQTTEFRKWHVDHLLEHADIVDMQIDAGVAEKAECQLAQSTGFWAGAVPVPGFGASDCRCDTHLHYFTEKPFYTPSTNRFIDRLPQMYRRLEDAYRNHADDERSPFKTLVSCILSLRTKDPVTDQATERLFNHLKTPSDFAQAPAEQISQWIYPVGMYRQKARRLVSIAQTLLSEHGGNVPSDTESLTRLPGVGRKTATLVQSFAFHTPAVCVDTHVHRISNRLRFVRTSKPEETEQALMKVLPRDYWARTNPLLVQHGQNICKPVRPLCNHCFLRPDCGIREIEKEQQLLSDIGFSPPHPSLSMQSEG